MRYVLEFELTATRCFTRIVMYEQYGVQNVCVCTTLPTNRRKLKRRIWTAGTSIPIHYVGRHSNCVLVYAFEYEPANI